MASCPALPCPAVAHSLCWQLVRSKESGAAAPCLLRPPAEYWETVYKVLEGILESSCPRVVSKKRRDSQCAWHASPGCHSAWMLFCLPRWSARPDVSNLSSPRTFHLSSSSISTRASVTPKPARTSLTSRTSLELLINAVLLRVALWLSWGQFLSLVLTDYSTPYRPCSQGASCPQPAPPTSRVAVPGVTDTLLQSRGCWLSSRGRCGEEDRILCSYCFICGAPCESKEVMFLLMFSFLPFFQTITAVILRQDFVYVWLA